jgi:LysR family transcriptional regulator, salicylic acid-responsive activator of bsdBCD
MKVLSIRLIDRHIMDDNARYFLTVAETGSISAAARRLHLSQPALSQRLKQLETCFGTTLFDRKTTPLTPTQAGQVYLEWARKTVDAEDVMSREINAIANKTTRRLQIGVSLPRANSLLPEIIERFYRSVEGCVIFIYEAGMPDSHDRLLSLSEVDCTVFTPVRPEPTLFHGETICEERLLLVAPASWDIPAQDAGEAYPLVSLQSIGALPFIMPPRHLKHNWIIRNMMDAAGVRLHIALHSCSNEMTFETIRRGLGVSIVPNTFISPQTNEDLSSYLIKGCSNRSSLYYNRPLNGETSNDEQVFIKIAKEWIAEHPMFMPATGRSATS